MNTTNGGLLGKYFNMKVTKCEIQYTETFRKGYCHLFLFSFFICIFIFSEIQTSTIGNLSKSNKFFGFWSFGRNLPKCIMANTKCIIARLM